MTHITHTSVIFTGKILKQNNYYSEIPRVIYRASTSFGTGKVCSMIGAIRFVNSDHDSRFEMEPLRMNKAACPSRLTAIFRQATIPREG